MLKRFFAICISITAGSQSFSQVNELNQLTATEDYYQLRLSYAENIFILDEFQKLYYKSFIDFAYNSPVTSNESIQQLFGYHNHRLSDSLRAKLLQMEVSNHVNLFEYKRALEASDLLLSKYSVQLDSAELHSIRNSSLIWKAIAETPKQISNIKRGINIPLKKDKAKLWNVTISSAAGTTEDFLFDTGANFSVVSESTANQFGWKVIEADFEVTGGTGKKVKSKIAVADSVLIGESVFRNVIFLLMPDESLTLKPSPFFTYKINGIIGLPVIKDFKEIQIFNEGYLNIPQETGKKDYRNFVINSFVPVLYASVNGKVLGFHFDTGANTTQLYKTYLNFLPADAMQELKSSTVSSGSAGGSIKTDIFRIDKFELTVAGTTTSVSNVRINKEFIKSNEKYTYGNLGQDVLKQFKCIDINFDAMYIELKK